MKAKLFFSALVAIATMSAWAQAPIVNFPQELGTADYGKVGDVPKEFKDATSVLYKTEVDGNIIAEYIGIYGYPYICSFDSDMNMYFPPKEFSDKKTRYIGVNEAEQVVVAKVAKKGTDVCLLDKQMNLVKSLNIIYADVYFDKSIGHMSVENDKIFLILWQYESKKVQHWMGYILDANTLEILSQTDMGSSYHSQFIYSENKEYIGCIAVDETKGKYLRHPLYNGANIRLMDKNFHLLQERYVYGNIDDPWVWAQDEKTRKKIYNGGMTGILTNGDYHIQVNNDGVLRYITLDAASAHVIKAFSADLFSIRGNRLSIYTLSTSKNDSVSISDVMPDKIFMEQTLINADENNIIMQAWYKNEQRQTASTGYVVLNMDMNTNELAILTDEKKIFPANNDKDSRYLYGNNQGFMMGYYNEKGNIFYEMWYDRDGKDIRFPRFEYSQVYMEALLKPIQSRSIIAHSNATDVSCFLVHESLNTGFNIDTPIETTKPLYLEFINKDGILAEYVFPEITYDMVSFGVLGGRKAYKSLLTVNASSIDDTSIRLYIKLGDKHQWVTLSPNLFDANYKASHPEKF